MADEQATLHRIRSLDAEFGGGADHVSAGAEVPPAARNRASGSIVLPREGARWGGAPDARFGKWNGDPADRAAVGVAHMVRDKGRSCVASGRGKRLRVLDGLDRDELMGPRPGSRTRRTEKLRKRRRGTQLAESPHGVLERRARGVRSSRKVGRGG